MNKQIIYPLWLIAALTASAVVPEAWAAGITVMKTGAYIEYQTFTYWTTEWIESGQYITDEYGNQQPVMIVAPKAEDITTELHHSEYRATLIGMTTGCTYNVRFGGDSYSVDGTPYNWTADLDLIDEESSWPDADFTEDCTPPPEPDPCVDPILVASDSSASSTRAVSDGGTLKLVIKPDSVRTATLSVGNCSDFLSGYPQWSGVMASNGTSVVSYGSGMPGSVGITADTGSNSMSVTVELVPEDASSVTIGKDDIKAKFDNALGKMTLKYGSVDESADTDISGEIEFKRKKVDAYNSPDVADYRSAEGTLSATVVKEAKWTSPPLPLGLISAKVKGTLGNLNGQISAKGVADPSIPANTVEVSMGFAADVKGEVLFEPSVTQATNELCQIGTSVSAKTEVSIKGTATFSGVPTTVTVAAATETKDIDIQWNVYMTLAGGIKCEQVLASGKLPAASADTEPWSWTF